MNRKVRETYEMFDVATTHLVRKARNENGWPTPCKRGCDACCYDVALVVQPEVEELVERVRSMSLRKRDYVRAGIRDWLDGMAAAGLDPDNASPEIRAYHRGRLRCPLLDTERHECMAYDVRPLACRGHFVVGTDASACANRAEVPVVGVLEMPETFAAGMVGLVKAAGVRIADMRDALLPRALGNGLGIHRGAP